MKDIKEMTLNLPEEEYHALPCLSYSKLARYSREGFKALGRLDEPVPESREMLFGSLVDCMATRGMEEAGRRYTVLCAADGSGNRAAAVRILLRDFPGVPWDGISDEARLRALDEADYRTMWKAQTRLEYFSGYEEYHAALLGGKTPVKQEDWDDAVLTAEAVTGGSAFGVMAGDADEAVAQAQFRRTLTLPSGRRADVKCMFDWLFIDHAKKTIRPTDLKTCGMPAYDFARHWVEMRYYIQAQLYVDVLKDALFSEPDWWEYRILPFLFTAVSRIDKVPVVYEYDPGQSPVLCVNDKEYKNWMTLADEVLDWEENPSGTPPWIAADRPNDILGVIEERKQYHR